MRTLIRSAALVLVGAFVVACSTPASVSPSASTGPSAAASPSAEASAAASAEAPSASATACAKESLATKTAGKLTIATDNPAFPPYFDPPASGEPKTDPWELGDPTNGRGFESAVAYAVADKLGFAKEDVSWTYVKFENAYAPGPKPFDFDINQVSFTPERAQAVDMSDGYYTVNQALVANKDTPITKVTTVSGLKDFKLGAQQGTTSYQFIQDAIQPSTETSVYDDNTAAIAALDAKQIDGIVVDLPTAFYITAAQMKNGVIVGQFQANSGGDAEHFSLVLEKGSTLTSCVNEAIAALKSDGTLDAITKEWLSDKANAPVFQP